LVDFSDRLVRHVPDGGADRQPADRTMGAMANSAFEPFIRRNS